MADAAPLTVTLPAGSPHLSALCPPADADECVLFGPALCENGRCLNTVPGYICLCNPGYHYDASSRKCQGEDSGTLLTLCPTLAKSPPPGKDAHCSRRV